MRVGPKCNDILIWKELSGDRRTEREHRHLETKEENGLTRLKAKECGALLTTTKSYKQARKATTKSYKQVRKDSSLEPSEGAPHPPHTPTTLILDF